MALKCPGPEASDLDGGRSYVGTQGHWPRTGKANISELRVKVTFVGLALRLLLVILPIAYYRVWVIGVKDG